MERQTFCTAVSRWLWGKESENHLKAQARVADIGQCQVNKVRCAHVSFAFTNAWSSTAYYWRAEQPGRVYDDQEFESSRSELTFDNDFQISPAAHRNVAPQ